ncbi:MAG: hypothetical protein GXY83_40370 [Rhodopirellula sp.]|nr:hypothetical protein [Rhodopirellula sp.]
MSAWKGLTYSESRVRLERMTQAFVQQYRLPGLPAALAELNSGVILFRKSQQVESLLRRWQSRYCEATDAATVAENPNGIGDQQVLSQVVWESGVRIMVVVSRLTATSDGLRAQR